MCILCNIEFPVSRSTSQSNGSKITCNTKIFMGSSNISHSLNASSHLPLSRYLHWPQMQKARRALATPHSGNGIQEMQRGGTGREGVIFQTILTSWFGSEVFRSFPRAHNHRPRAHRLNYALPRWNDVSPSQVTPPFFKDFRQHWDDGFVEERTAWGASPSLFPSHFPLFWWI